MCLFSLSVVAASAQPTFQERWLNENVIRVEDPTSGVVRRIYFGRTVQNFAASATSTNELLREYEGELGLSLRHGELHETPKTLRTLAGSTAIYQQMVGDLPVYRGEVLVSLGRGSQPQQIVNNAIVPAPALPSYFRQIDEAEAIEAARDALFRGELRRFVAPKGLPKGELDPSQVRPNGVYGTPTAMKEVYVSDGEAFATYRVSLIPDHRLADYRVWVDLGTGEVVGAEDMAAYHRGRARIFDPDPKSRLRKEGLRESDPEDFFTPAYLEAVLLGLADANPQTGLYSLSGEYARSMELEAPAVALAAEKDPRLFRYTRRDPRFEEAMIYYFIDLSQRYIQSLGYNGKDVVGIQKQPIAFDAHGVNGEDNSHFIPALNQLAFGDGGVNDAEDADVILHEYGHAIQHGMNPNWGGGHQRAMGEGFGDYWATTYTRPKAPGFHENWVFMWDGHNDFWPGRVTDARMHYPQDAQGGLYTAGMLWSATLWDVRRAIGDATVADRIILEHHFSLGSTATMEDAARALIMADNSLYGGEHVLAMVKALKSRGFVAN